MSYEIRIPASRLTEEGFTALKAQTRIFLGMPAEVMPHSIYWLYKSLHPHWIGYPFRKWLRDNGYEVVRSPAFEMGPEPYHVIRRADVETIMYDNMGRNIMEDIDEAVLRKIKGKC